jgi:hypothetical protein
LLGSLMVLRHVDERSGEGTSSKLTSIDVAPVS